MNIEQFFLLGLLGFLVMFFIWERWRYNLVALGALLLSTSLGFIPAEEAFLGFGHPAVITVAAVLIISRGLSNVRAVGIPYSLYQMFTSGSPSLHVAVLASAGGLISTVMHNIGALALLMPWPFNRPLMRNALRLSFNATGFWNDSWWEWSRLSEHFLTSLWLIIGQKSETSHPLVPFYAHRPPRQFIVMSPGGYRFGDYWRKGLPLELLILLVSLPLILAFWPLRH